MKSHPFFALSIILSIMFAILTYLILVDATFIWDPSFNRNLVETFPLFARSLFKLITKLANTSTITLGVLLVIWLTRHHCSAAPIRLFILTSVGGSAMLNLAIKNIIQRPRPIFPHFVEASGYSFPSGHAMTGTVFYMALMLLSYHLIDQKEDQSLHLNPLLIRCLVLILPTLVISLIAISRVVLNVHYLTDVLGGIIAGGAWISLVISLLGKRRINHESSSSD